MTDNIIYSTGLGGSYNLLEAEHNEALRKEREMHMEWEFSDPVSLDEEHEQLQYFPCGCDTYGCFCEDNVPDLTDEYLQEYDDNCEDYEEAKRKRLFEEQEY